MRSAGRESRRARTGCGPETICYAFVVRIPQRELRNNVSAVLRRVEAGERLTVTVHGRPVAELVPLPRRRQWVPAREVWPLIQATRADPGLAHKLRELFPGTTDDLRGV